MGNFIPNGPLIQFRFDVPQSAGAAAAVFDPVKKQARETSAQVADEWRRMAAQIRASTAQGILSTKEEASLRQSVVAVLEREVGVLRQKNELSSKELSNLKAMTLELERQKSFIKGTGGLTAGTHAAIGQFSTQTYLGITRALDSIVNRYFGGAAGSIFRTVRDLGYYSSIGAGGVAGEGGRTSGILGKIVSPAGLATLGGVGALTAAGVALGVMADKGGKLAVELTDMAQKTGLSTQAAIRLNTAAGVLGVSMDSIGVGFKKFDTLITEANAGNKKAVQLFNDLGINIKKAAEDPFSAIQRLAKVFAAIPTPALRIALATELFGRGGQQLVPILSELDKVMGLTSSSSEDLARALGTDVRDSAITARAALANWRNETDALEIALGQRLLPTLIKVVGIINDTFSGQMPKLNTQSDVQSYLQHTLGSQFTPYGASEFRNFLARAPHPENARPYQMFNAFFDWEKSRGVVDSSKLIERYKETISGTGDAAAKASVDVKRLNADVGNFGKAALTAQEKFWKQVGENLFRSGPARPLRTRAGEQVVGGRLLGGAALSRAIPAPGLGVGLEAQTGNLLAGIGLGAPGVGVNVPTTSEGMLQVILGGDYNKIFNTREDQYRRELAQLKQALDEKLISYQEYNQAALSINNDLHEEMMRQNREFNHQADDLFQQLITGDRNFGRTLVKDLQDSLLAPIRNSFDQIVGGLLGGFSRGVNAGYQGTLGGIFGHGGLSRFATVPFLGNLIPGLGANKAAPTGAAGDPVHVVLAGVGTSGGGILGGTGLSAGGNGIIGGLLPLLGLGDIGGAGGASGIGALPLLRDASGNLIGGSSGGGSLLSKIFGGLFGGGQSGAAHGGFFGLGGKVGGGIAGLGGIGGGLLMGLGASTGGALGGLEGAAGGALSGALTGFTMGGPIGAAIGGIIGGIGGLITGILGPSWDTRVRKAMVNQAYYAPPSETFSFASNGSIAQTLATGFAQSGGHFSQFGLPSNTPFYASAITGPLSYRDYLLLQQENNQLNTGQPFLGFPGTNPYVGQGPLAGAARTAPPAMHFHFELPGYLDASSAEAALTPIASKVAAIVSRQVYTSGAGFGSSARKAVNLP